MDQLEDMLLELKDTSELMIDLAYSSLIYKNRDIAEEVMFLENHVNELTNDFQTEAMRRGFEEGDMTKALLLVRLAKSVEEISDGAMQIADVILRDVEPHPVIYLSVMESEVIITTATVSEDSDLVGRELGEIKLPSKCGMWIIAIKKGDRFQYGPEKKTVLEPGDVLISRGPEDGEGVLKNLTLGKYKLDEWDE